jgi:hypothetical protein
MRSKLAISAVVVASLFGATAIASAQPMAGPSAEGNATASKMASHKMKRHHTTRYSRAQMDKSRPGGRPISRKPPS